ncbi:hypothetical protein GGQ64_002099 [Rhizobium azooxidifex]|uniref:Uncharacterized protein n=1 Tax=Mycoplana azooxidifex TaxID=1636188 RepID=A0A7W6D6P1_9HYPH|nr:hypothetical protein [Mycoplana azooxidifex]
MKILNMPDAHAFSGTRFSRICNLASMTVLESEVRA